MRIGITVTPSIPLSLNKSLGEEDDLAGRIFIDGVGGSAPPNSYSTIQPFNHSTKRLLYSSPGQQRQELPEVAPLTFFFAGNFF
ncbi:hypothetical protein [Caldithrix abyssi]|uniref:hypothetical protein n=1 Tax=Caldithrix abyssi TaxID=187145 RepID=UPI0012374F43|nr:hypothetical protein [Caldithrix abyssi]